MSVKADKELDARGLNCPLPVLKTKKAMEELQAGQVLKMMATDPGSVNDMDSWAKRTGNEIIEREESNGEFSFYIKKS